MSPAALQPALCTCLSPAQPLAPALLPPPLPQDTWVLPAVRPGLESSSPAGPWHCPFPTVSSGLGLRLGPRKVQRHGAIVQSCSQAAGLPAGRMGPSCAGQAKHLPLPSGQQAGLGHRLERQSARWAVTGLSRAGLLLDKPQSSPGCIPHFWAKDMLSLGSSLTPPPIPHFPSPHCSKYLYPQHFPPSCNLLEGGLWLPAGPWVDSSLSPTHLRRPSRLASP